MTPRRHFLLVGLGCYLAAALIAAWAWADENVYLGQSAGENQASSTGDRNTGIGYRSLRENRAGYENTALGTRALQSNIDGFGNTALGRDALTSNTSGLWNVAIGAGALATPTTASDNNAVGNNALHGTTSGRQNNAMGGSAMSGNTTGLLNAAFGDTACFYNTSGSMNSCLGPYAGVNPANDIAQFRVTTDTYLTLIGHGATKNNTAQLTNATAIGSGAHVTKSHQIVLGNDAVTETVLRGSVRVNLPDGPVCVVNGALVSCP